MKNRNATTSVTHTKITLYPSPRPDLLRELDERSHYLHHEFCWWWEPGEPMKLPDHLQQQIDEGTWSRELTILQANNLINLEVAV